MIEQVKARAERLGLNVQLINSGAQTIYYRDPDRGYLLRRVGFADFLSGGRGKFFATAEYET